jgi:hypothetical protein
MSKIIGGYEYKLSPTKNKKLRVIVNGKTIDFGDIRYEHYFDKTGLLNKGLNHNDKERQKSYLARATNILDKNGRKTEKDPSSANYHAIKILW